MPERISSQPLGVSKMSKRQKTYNNPQGSSESGTDTSNQVKLPGNLKAVMLTTTSPPNMNIVDFSDTISDVEDDEIPTDLSTKTTSKKSRKCKSKREKRKVKQPKQKVKNQRDSAEDKIHNSDDELFHKDTHKQKPVQSSSGGNP